MPEQVCAPRVGKTRRILGEIAGGRTAAALDFLFRLSVAYLLAVIAARAMPYRMVSEWRLPFLRIENAMYLATLLFIIRKFIRPSNEPHGFFISPLEGCGGAEPRRINKKDLVLCVAVFLFSILYLMVIYDKGIPNPDEGWLLTLSERALKGEIPHKDFFILTTPGALYVNAWVFGAFGATIAVERTLTLVLAALASSIFYALARIGMSFFFSVGASLLFLVWQFPSFFQASYSWYAVVFSMAAFWVMGLTIMSGRKRGSTFLIIGLLCGLSFMFKQNTGMVTLAAVIIYFPAERVLFGPVTRRDFLGPFLTALPNSAEIAPLIKDCALLLLGFAIPLGLSACLYASNNHLAAYFEAIFLTPFIKSKEFVTPYVVLSRLTDKRVMAYMPHFTLLLTLVSFLRKLRRGRLEPKDRFPLLLAVATVFNFLTVFPRADIIHIIFALWPSLALLVYWVQQGVIAFSKRWQNTKPACYDDFNLDARLKNLYIAGLSCLVFAVLLVHRADRNISFHNDFQEIEAPRGRGIFGKKDAVRELNETIRFINDYSVRHGSTAMFSTNPLLYFLTSVPNVTSYDYVLAGNGPDGYVADILKTLERVKPDIVVFDTLFLRWYPIPADWWMIQNHVFRNYRLSFASSENRYVVFEPIGSNE